VSPLQLPPLVLGALEEAHAARQQLIGAAAAFDRLRVGPQAALCRLAANDLLTALQPVYSAELYFENLRALSERAGQERRL
jgi:hypothetical protein